MSNEAIEIYGPELMSILYFDAMTIAGRFKTAEKVQEFFKLSHEEQMQKYPELKTQLKDGHYSNASWYGLGCEALNFVLLVKNLIKYKSSPYKVATAIKSNN